MTSGPAPQVHVSSDRQSLVLAVVARLTDVVAEALAAKDVVHLVLTGGGVGTAVLSGLRNAPVAWPRVHLWWGDERFLPAGHEDRNETQARSALIDHVPLMPGHVHPMPAVDQVADVDTAAAAYRDELAGYAATAGTVAVPPFDVVLLGVGDDAHVASLFPGLPGPQVDDRTVVGVRDSPKPPPLRVSLTFPAIHRGAQVWLLVSGPDKADAVARAFTGERPGAAPAAGAAGREATVWFLDEAAATRLPR